MGSSASCSIVLAPRGKSFYWTGETISGNVILRADRSLKVKSIDVKIIGQLVVTERGSDGPSTIRETFYVERHSLFIPPTNGISYDADGYYLEPNTYQWPFSVRLAKDLPPSLTDDDEDTPYIDYFLKVKVGRPSFRRNIHSKLPIWIIPRVSRPRNVRSVEREETNLRDLYVYGKVLRNYLSIGEPYITLELNIENPSQTTIKEIMVKLIQHRRLANRRGVVLIFHKSLPDIIDFQSNYLHRTFRVPVSASPRSLAPSSSYRNPAKPAKLWIIDYAFQVTIKTKLFFTNVTLDFPLTVTNSTNNSRTKYRNTVH